jgi:carbon monoxide dehydrogenase subunit G
VRIEDQFVVAASPAQVWRAIIDPMIVAPCVPGCESIELLSPTVYRATVKVEIGPIKARFNLTVEVKEQIPYTEIRSVTRGEEGTRASIVSAENVLRLAATQDGGTEIRYASEVTVAGRLGKFGFGIMQKKAKALGEDFAKAFRDKVLAQNLPAPAGGMAEALVPPSV